MLSETIVDFINSVRGESQPMHVCVNLEPQECFAFLAFVSSYSRWWTTEATVN